MEILIALLLAIWSGAVVYVLFVRVPSPASLRVRRYSRSGYKEEPRIPLWKRASLLLGSVSGRIAPKGWLQGVDHKLYWAHRAGKWEGWRSIDVWGLSLLAGTTGALLITLLSGSVLYGGMAGLLLFFYPTQKLDTDYQKVVNEVLRELPGAMHNVALVVESGASIEEALRRVSVRKSAFSSWLRGVLSKGAVEPIFSNPRVGVKGALLKEAERSGSEELVFMAVQLDLIYQRGTNIWELLDELALKVSEKRWKRMEEKVEGLENKLTLVVTIFFFLPYVVLILYPPFRSIMLNLGR